MAKRRLQARQLKPLPLGQILPRGWLQQQLQIQAAGLGGHLDEVWPDLGPDNRWLGGDREGWERGPYFADGLIPLAALLQDSALQAKAEVWVEAFLAYQNPDGWIGPANEQDGGGRDPWPVFVVLKALRQWYQWQEDDRVLSCMLSFCEYLRAHLGRHPLQSWAKYRWADLVVTLHWLYEETEADLILELCDELQAQGYNWTEHFMDFRLRKEQSVQMDSHVVNNAMGIKSGGVWYRQSGNTRDWESMKASLNSLDRFHGQANGMFSGDEHLAGKNPSRGTELCAVVEMMYSLEELLSVSGEPLFAERLEQIAYNALPAAFSPDMWSHQYDQQANQVICNVAERPWSNGPDANIFGLEPHFGCCTANFHQGWPKFAAHLWMERPGQGFALTSYAPSLLQTTWQGKKVAIETRTDYPFRDTVSFQVSMDEPMELTLQFPIPRWASQAALIHGDGSFYKGEPGEYLTVRRQWNPGDEWTLTLPQDIRLERRYRGGIAVKRGPLVYALKLEEQWQYLGGQMPAADWEVYPLAPWNYGLSLDGAGQLTHASVAEKPVGALPFSPQNAPLEIRVQGCLVPPWHLWDNSAAPVPASPLAGQQPRQELVLIPYGCTNLRVTEFPGVQQKTDGGVSSSAQFGEEKASPEINHSSVQ